MDAEASLVVLSQCGVLTGRMLELGLDGCRMRTEKRGALLTPTAVEVLFKINGIAFRLAGILERLEGLTAAVRFSPMPARRRQAILDLLAELAEGVRSREASEGTPGDPGEKKSQAPASPNARVGVLAMPAGAAKPDSRPPGAKHPAGPVPAPISIARPSPASSPYRGQPSRTSAPGGEPSCGRDRRAQARQAVDTRAIIFLIDVRSQVVGRIVDLSLGGCRIRTDQRFPVGIYRRIETEFALDGLAFRLAGVVQALHDKFTLGIRFLDMSARKKEQLALLMDEIEEMKKAGTEGPREQGTEKTGSRE